MRTQCAIMQAAFGRAQFENAIQADTPDEFNGRPARIDYAP